MRGPAPGVLETGRGEPHLRVWPCAATTPKYLGH